MIYYFLSPFSIFTIIALIVVFIVLNNKINKINEKLNLLEGKEISPRQDFVQTKFNEVKKEEKKIDNVVKVTGEEKGGRLLGKIGVIAILLAGAFFIKDVPDQGKIIIGIIVGILFIGLGFYLKSKYLKYAHVLMGGGIGLLYLTVYGASSVFHMISPSFGFGLMIFITIISAIISIMENAVSLAILGSIGAFLTPILISTGQNNYIELFSYIIILDLGILIISYKKKWQYLYHIGFWGTAILFFVWFENYFNRELFFATITFFTIYFLIFLLSSIFHHIIRKEKTNNADLFGISANAIMYFSVGLSLIDNRFGDNLGYFAFIVAIIYAIFAYISYKTMPEDKLLNYFLLGISVTFLSITMPLQFSGYWITVSWLIEGLVLYAISFYTPYQPMKKFALIVFGLGLFRVVFFEKLGFDLDTIRNIAFLNMPFFIIVLAIIIAYIIAHLYKKFEGIENLSSKKMIALFILTANVLTICVLTSQIYLFYEKKTNSIRSEFDKEMIAFNQYRGNGAYSEDLNLRKNEYSSKYYLDINKINNQRNTTVSIVWALYAILLIAVGFMKKEKFLRVLGLSFFIITALKIFFDVWNLGTQYRVISLVVFGVIALLGSFGYAKYKSKII